MGDAVGRFWIGQCRKAVTVISVAARRIHWAPVQGRRKRRGASAVEFAVVAPVIFLLIFGMIEFGRLVMVQQILTNAAREGARRAILQDATAGAVIQTVRNYLTNCTINGNNPNLVISVTPAPEQAQATDETITVAVSLPYRDVSWLPSPFFLGSTTMNARSVMRRETF